MLDLRTVRRYADQFAWLIARGHYASEVLSPMPCCCGATLSSKSVLCSCGRYHCAAPGCHPVADDLASEATNDLGAIEQLWGVEQWWPIALTGIDFDAVVVEGPLPASVLTRAERGEQLLGLTLTWRDEWHAFFTAPGALEGHSAAQRDGVSVRGPGSWVPLPAVALRSPARWVSSPAEGKGLILNDADTLSSVLPTEASHEQSESA